MDKVISTKQATELSKNLHKANKRIVLAGGCFDILHQGHLTFLTQAKQTGDVLMILLEADQTITQKKGAGRPVNSHQARANLLAALTVVDYVVLLPPMLTNYDYDVLVTAIKPAIIATTKGDPGRKHKERQAKLTNARVRDVTSHIEKQSTTKLLSSLKGFL